jgi:hypothetical protein
VFRLDEVPELPAEPCGIADVIPGTILVRGTLEDSSITTPIPGLTVDAMPGGVATTNAQGQFAIEIPTSGKPLHVVLATRGQPAYPDHTIHHQRGFDATPADASTKLLSSMSLDMLYGTQVRDPAASTLVVSVRDCRGDGVAATTVTVEPAAAVVYQGGGPNTDGTGLAYALNVPVGSVTIMTGTATPFTIDVAAGVAEAYVVQP